MAFEFNRIVALLLLFSRKRPQTAIGRYSNKRCTDSAPRLLLLVRLRPLALLLLVKLRPLALLLLHKRHLQSRLASRKSGGPDARRKRHDRGESDRLLRTLSRRSTQKLSG